VPEVRLLEGYRVLAALKLIINNLKMNDETPVPTHRNATRLGIEVMIGNLNLPKTPVMALHEMKNAQSSKLCLVGFFPVAVSSEDDD
jgi:hypothetical protein